jgi:hypothetical protein
MSGRIGEVGNKVPLSVLRDALKRALLRMRLILFYIIFKVLPNILILRSRVSGVSKDAQRHTVRRLE